MTKTYLIKEYYGGYIHDEPGLKEDMACYFNDLHNVFMKRMAEFTLKTETSEFEAKELKSLLDEMIRVRKVIQE